MFLDLLLQIHRRYRFEIHAYCLMPNHYHILVRTPLANLSRGMRHLDGLYTQYYNRKYKKDGALFRGRYKSILIDTENYLLRLSRYIHLNPVKAGLVINFIVKTSPLLIGFTPKKYFLILDQNNKKTNTPCLLWKKQIMN
jgi:REP element-mobilizing transposase RayT